MWLVLRQLQQSFRGKDLKFYYEISILLTDWRKIPVFKEMPNIFIKIQNILQRSFSF